MYLCLCSDKTEDEVVKLISEGINDIETITELTEIGSGCGTCVMWVEKLIAEQKDRVTS